MNRFIQTLAFATMLCSLTLGCSSGDNSNVTQNASQQEIDDYNALIEQAQKEMSGDGDMDKFKD